MGKTRKPGYWLAWLLLAAAGPLPAQQAGQVRGGWIADIDDQRHVYLLVVREREVTGVHCAGDCRDPDNLVFIDDGVLDDDGLRFTLYRDDGDGSPRRDPVTGQLVDGRLHLLGNGTATQVLRRSPRVEIPPAPSGGFGPPPPPYQPPAAPAELSAEQILGLWLFGDGPDKQYFIFKRHRDGIRGMVCGPCEDASNMAPLENVRLRGSRLRFDILHEDSGPGIREHGPHHNAAVATVIRNEMHLSVVPSFETDAFTPIEMTLLGPVVYQP